jgi:hypothetical protein
MQVLRAPSVSKRLSKWPRFLRAAGLLQGGKEGSNQGGGVGLAER